MNFTASQKGPELAIHEGYIYRRGSKIENGLTWRCNEAHCKGRISPIKDEIKVNNEHSEVLYRKYVRMAAAFAFLPSEDVIKGFELFKDCNGESDLRVLEYFEGTYIGVPKQIEAGRRAPKFAVNGTFTKQ